MQITQRLAPLNQVMLATPSLEVKDLQQQTRRPLWRGVARRLCFANPRRQGCLFDEYPRGEPREISGLACALELRVECPAQRVQRGITELSNERREAHRRQPGQFCQQRPGRSQPIRAIASV